MKYRTPLFGVSKSKSTGLRQKIGRAYEQYLYDLPPDQQYRAASLALEEFVAVLSNERVGNSNVGRYIFQHHSLTPISLSSEFRRKRHRLIVDTLDIEKLTFLKRPYDSLSVVTSHFDYEYPNYSDSGPTHVTVFTDEIKETNYNEWTPSVRLWAKF